MKTLTATLLLALTPPLCVAAEPTQLKDKTLVVWAESANLTQRAGSALTIDDEQSHFDAIVFGEITPRKWMAGSDTFRRTQREQTNWPEETTEAGTFVQMAIVYRGREVTILRNGSDYAHYTVANEPQVFGPQAAVVFCKRHLDVTDRENSFVGRIKGPYRVAGCRR